MRSLLLLSVALCLAWSQEKRVSASDLLDADRAFYTATNERGLDGWMEWFAPDAVALSPDGRLVSGADDIRAFYAAQDFPPAGFSWAPESAEIAASGDLGYTVGSWEMRLPDAEPDAPPVAGGRYLTVWKRQEDGSFRALADGGGATDFRTNLAGLDGPPRAWSSTTDRTETSASGELAFAIGAWEAKAVEKSLKGRNLTVWMRDEDGAWAIADEVGFSY